MKVSQSQSILLLSLLSIWPAIAAPNPLGRFVVVGDSLTAGFQNFSLYTSSTVPHVSPGGQEYGYAQVVAQQAGTDLRNPKVLYPGLPPTLTIDSAKNIFHAPGLGFRLNPLMQTLNLSVPSYTVADALKNKIVYSQVPANPTDALALTVYGVSLCGVQGFSFSSVTVSSVDCAVELRPDTVLVSLGSNDALQALTLGSPTTDPTVFQMAFRDVLGRLKGTGARIIVANVPDITATPYLWTRAAIQTRCGAAPGTANYFVVNLVDPTQASGDICRNYVPVPDQAVADIKKTVDDYNVRIKSEADAVRAVVLDINGLFKEVSTGYKISDKLTLTTAFLGGLFSLDGLHPTNTGYAIMANRTIDTINQKWNLKIPKVDLEKVASKDPLVPPIKP